MVLESIHNPPPPRRVTEKEESPPPPTTGHWKGGMKAKHLEEKYEATLEFPGGVRGCKTKNLWGSMEINWNYTQCEYHVLF